MKNLLWFIFQWHLHIQWCLPFGAAIQDQFILAFKGEGNKARERIGSFTRANGVTRRWNRFIMGHPHNPLPNRPSYPHLKQQAPLHCQYKHWSPTGIQNSLNASFAEAARLFRILRSCAEPLDKVAWGRGARGEEKKRGIASKIFSS